MGAWESQSHLWDMQLFNQGLRPQRNRHPLRKSKTLLIQILSIHFEHFHLGNPLNNVHELRKAMCQFPLSSSRGCSSATANIEDTDIHRRNDTCSVCACVCVCTPWDHEDAYWFRFDNSDDDYLICFYLSYVECCTGMLCGFSCSVWQDELEKQKDEKWLNDLMFFYVLYIAIHFFQIKWMLVSMSAWVTLYKCKSMQS